MGRGELTDTEDAMAEMKYDNIHQEVFLFQSKEFIILLAPKRIMLSYLDDPTFSLILSLTPKDFAYRQRCLLYSHRFIVMTQMMIYVVIEGKLQCLTPMMLSTLTGVIHFYNKTYLDLKGEDMTVGDIPSIRVYWGTNRITNDGRMGNPELPTSLFTVQDRCLYRTRGDDRSLIYVFPERLIHVRYSDEWLLVLTETQQVYYCARQSNNYRVSFSPFPLMSMKHLCPTHYEYFFCLDDKGHAYVCDLTDLSCEVVKEGQRYQDICLRGEEVLMLTIDGRIEVYSSDGEYRDELLMMEWEDCDSDDEMPHHI